MRRTTAVKRSPFRRQTAGPSMSELPQTVQQLQNSKFHKRRRKRSSRSSRFMLWFRALLVLAQRKDSGEGLRSAVIVTLGFLIFLCFLGAGYMFPPENLRRTASIPVQFATPYSMTFPLSRAVSQSILLPPRLALYARKESHRKDYGELEIRIMEEDEPAREIMHDSREDESFDPDYDPAEHDDNVDDYYAFDDDIKRNPMNGWDDPYIQDRKRCRRTNWHRSLFINCNNVHEFDLQSVTLDGATKFLGEGAYRQVYLAELESETVVYKDYYFDNPFAYDDYEYMRMDAIVAERLSWSPRIVDIYGFCALSMLNEAMPHGDIEDLAVPIGGREPVRLEDEEDVDPQNNLTASEKLTYALDMAESVLLLHSFSDGIIVHDDIQLGQFLLTGDGHVKLNDFNRAEIMLWNEKHQEYCGYRNNPGMGDWRAPEEYLDRPLNEKIDIWSLGNNFYALLTGLVPMYDIMKLKKVQKMVIDGKTGFIDPRYRERSLAERALVEVIELCWEYDPEKRIDIFELVRRLRAAVRKNRRYQDN